MTTLNTKVASAYPDTFCIQRTDDALFALSPEQINEQAYLQIGDAKYKLVVRHTDCNGQMFFYILRDEHKDNYAAYYSGPTPFSGEIMAWDLDPIAFIGSSSLLTADQDIIFIYDKPSLPQNVNVCVNNVSDKLDVQINYDGKNLNISIKLAP